MLGKTCGVGGAAWRGEGCPHRTWAAGAGVVHLLDLNVITSSRLPAGRTPAPGPGEESEHPRNPRPLSACSHPFPVAARRKSRWLETTEVSPCAFWGQKLSTELSAKPGPLSENSGGTTRSLAPPTSGGSRCLLFGLWPRGSTLGLRGHGASALLCVSHEDTGCWLQTHLDNPGQAPPPTTNFALKRPVFPVRPVNRFQGLGVDGFPGGPPCNHTRALHRWERKRGWRGCRSRWANKTPSVHPGLQREFGQAAASPAAQDPLGRERGLWGCFGVPVSPSLGNMSPPVRPFSITRIFP